MRLSFCLILIVCGLTLGCQTVYQVHLLAPTIEQEISPTGTSSTETEIAFQVVDDFAKENGFVTNTGKYYQLIDENHACKMPKILLSVSGASDGKLITVVILDEPPEAHVHLASSLTRRLRDKLVAKFGKERVRMQTKGVYDPTWLGFAPTREPSQRTIILTTITSL